MALRKIAGLARKIARPKLMKGAGTSLRRPKPLSTLRGRKSPPALGEGARQALRGAGKSLRRARPARTTRVPLRKRAVQGRGFGNAPRPASGTPKRGLRSAVRQTLQRLKPLKRTGKKLTRAIRK